MPNCETSELNQNDQALVEIATKIAGCVDAQADASDTLSDHSDQLTAAQREIKSLKNKNFQLERRLDTIDAALKETK